MIQSCQERNYVFLPGISIVSMKEKFSWSLEYTRHRESNHYIVNIWDSGTTQLFKKPHVFQIKCTDTWEIQRGWRLSGGSQFMNLLRML